MTEPHDFGRRVLLAVTGLTTQVVTETLFALAVTKRPPWIPTEVHIITTKVGAQRAQADLLDPETGWLHRLCSDYSLPDIGFEACRILAIKGDAGEPIEDICTVEDNTRTADVLTEEVRVITDDSDCALHVSIAGGRKTMGFYAGYALSLYGRVQDRLSHVMVDAHWESNPTFFYPRPNDRPSHADGWLRDGQAGPIHLAEIPFVRMREGLRSELLEGHVSFSEAVADAQRSMPPVRLALDVSSRTAEAGGVTLRFRNSQFAFLWMLAERARSGRPGLHWSEPVAAREYLTYYGRLVHRYSGRYEAAESKLGAGMSKSSFDPQKAHINRRFVDELGRRRASPYMISAQGRIPRTRYLRFGLKLQPTAIVIGGKD